MSVTFAPAFIGTGRFHIEALPEFGDTVTFGPFEGYEAAQEAYKALRPTFEVKYPYGAHIMAESVTGALPSLNVSVGNAVSILMVLDVPMSDVSPYGCDLSGSEDAATFMTRVMVALASDYDDDARPSLMTTTEGGGTFEDCGRRANYISERLTALYAVAEAAQEYGVAVQWG